jgi:hypothetical protein
MGLIEEQIKEIESAKSYFIKELEERISRLKKEGHIGHPNHLHFTVTGDPEFKLLMFFVLNTRGFKIYYEGKKMGNKFVADCSNQAYKEIIAFTLDNLSPMVYDKYLQSRKIFWDSMYQMFNKS